MTFYTLCIRVQTINFQRGSKGGEIASWQLHQTASHAYPKSVRQISSQLVSFLRGKKRLMYFLLNVKMIY